ncbi:hypothetical protein APHAL10511_000052 [Amanita phalloides]|nr:hypothetical protein APHAL10511_000052 [Amanita phalloides]
MDLDGVKQGLIENEFLAVILSGFGHELRPLTSNDGDEPFPKSLLPVANKPILEYALSWLEKSGIKDVLILCPESHHPILYHHINSEVSTSLTIDLQGFQEPQDVGAGTCALLRHFSGHITKDFILLPCDFVPPASFPLQRMLDKFRVDVVSNNAVLTTCWFPGCRPEKSLFPEEWINPSTSSIMLDEETESLLYIDSANDIDSNDENFEIRISLLSKYPRCKLLASYQDSHVYVCQRAVLDILCDKPHFLSFREEFLPFLCKTQHQLTRKRRYGQALLTPFSNSAQGRALEHSTVYTRICTTRLQKQVNVPPKGQTCAQPSLRIGVVLLTSGALRVNSLSTFFEINRRLLTSAAFVLPSDPKDRSLIDPKALISADSIVGSSTQVSARAMIKKSVIGRHCKIGMQAKVNNCILFDHCAIGDGARLDNCILGKNTKIGAAAEMTRCVTQTGFEVASGDVMRNEKLEISDWSLPNKYD